MKIFEFFKSITSQNEEVQIIEEKPKLKPTKQYVIKRNGTLELFDTKKIQKAIKAAFKASHTKIPAKEVLDKIINEIKEQDDLTVEKIQNLVEEYLMKNNYLAPAKEYILYRDKQKTLREWVNTKTDFINQFKTPGTTANKTIDDNSNVGNKNVAILNTEIHKCDNIQISRRMVMNKLAELFPDFKNKQYVKDLEDHIIYKHDESSFAGAIAPYCCSITMYPFLNEGIKGIGGLSSKPTNLDSFCGMYCNLIFATSSMFAGAIATSEFLLYFDYFCRKEWGNDYIDHIDEFRKYGKDMLRLQQLSRKNTLVATIEDIKKLEDNENEEVRNLAKKLVKSYKNGKCYDESRTIKSIIHQHFQQVIYTINQPAAARGFQAAFVNFSYFDYPFFEGMFGNFYFPDGTQPIWETLKFLQKDFMVWFNEERLKCIITFPVESFALVYKDNHFLDKEAADFVAEEYARGHSFFTYISDTVDSLSSCCRLKNKVQTKEFNFTNGNMGVETGSKSVITINLSRNIQDFWKSLDKDYKEELKAGITGSLKEGNYLAKKNLYNNKFYEKLYEYLTPILERIYKYHEAYNELLWDTYYANLLPVFKAGFIDLNKQYLTIGINGLNQAAEFLGIKCNDNQNYKIFCEKIFGFIKDMNNKHKQKNEAGHQMTFNCEQVPSESLAIKNYDWDKEDGYWVPKDTNLYASYIYKPNDDSLSVLDKLRLHGKEYIGDFLDGGAAAHINLSEHLSKKQYQLLLKYAADNGCQYFTWNIPNSECRDCGWIGKMPVTECPHCQSKNIDYYDRVIGYLTKIKNWSSGRQKEQKIRVYQNEKQTNVETLEK